MTSVLLDTHVLHWWSSEPERLSPAAAAAIEGAHDLAVAGITWYELAWLARHERIGIAVPVRSWLDSLAAEVLTIGVTPAIADTAMGLPTTFPGDPADRLIYATAIDHGLSLVTKDRRLHAHRHPRPVAVW